MTTILSGDASCARAAIMPPPAPSVQRRMLHTARAIGGVIYREPGNLNPELHGCLVLPLAGVLLVGTACARPFLFAELDALARLTSMDVLALRYDALRRRTTYDIKLQSQSQWLRCYVAEPLGVGLRMVPDTAIGPIVEVAPLGLRMVTPTATPRQMTCLVPSAAPVAMAEA